MIGLFGWAFKAMGNIHTIISDPTVLLSFAMIFIVWNCVNDQEYAKLKGTR